MKIHYRKQGEPPRDARCESYQYIEFPDNSIVAQVFRRLHPRKAAFEDKYRNVNWRQRISAK